MLTIKMVLFCISAFQKYCEYAIKKSISTYVSFGFIDVLSTVLTGRSVLTQVVEYTYLILQFNPGDYKFNDVKSEEFNFYCDKHFPKKAIIGTFSAAASSLAHFPTATTFDWPGYSQVGISFLYPLAIRHFVLLKMYQMK